MAGRVLVVAQQVRLRVLVDEAEVFRPLGDLHLRGGGDGAGLADWRPRRR